MTCRKIYTILFFLLTIINVSEASSCVDYSNTIKAICYDFEEVPIFVLTAEESELTFSKYKQNKYFPAFKDILQNRDKYDQEMLSNVLYIIAVTRNREFLEDVKNIVEDKDYNYKVKTAAPNYDYDLLDYIHFYFFRINFNKQESAKFLMARLNVLICKLEHINELFGKTQFGFHLITFLPFLDDPSLSIDFIDKLIPNADGSIAELIHWAFDYLSLINEENHEAMEIIRKSYGSKIFSGRNR